MSYVEAASADPTVCASRTQTPVGDSVPALDVPSTSGEDFASLFASTRQSFTWLNGLFDRRADQIAASQRRQQRITDVLSHGGQSEPPQRASYSEPGQSAIRADRLRESVQDRTQSSTDRADNAQRDLQATSDAGRAERHAVDESKPDTSRYSQQSEPPDYPRLQEPETIEPQAQRQENHDNKEVTATSADNVQDGGVDDAGSSGAPSIATGVNDQAPLRPLNVQSPSALTIQTQISSSVQNVQTTMTADMAKGGETGTGVSQDSLQVSTTAKGADGSAKPGVVTLDFQTILTHVGKGQVTGTISGNGLAAMGGKEAMGETVKLAGPESVQELARVVRSNLNSRHASMVLRLDPPELGQLRVDVRMHDQVLLLRFQTETQASMDALQTRLTDLRVALEQHGIQLDRVEVEFRPPPAPNSAGSQADQQQYHQNTDSGSDSFFGHAQGRNGSANESFGSSEFPGQAGQMQSETPPTGNNELMGDEVARSAETGVDLIV